MLTFAGMRKVKFHIAVILLFFILSHSTTRSQDVVFNHPYAGMLYVNPAYTGIFGPGHAGAAFRSQYTASASPYTTYYVEADAFVESWKSGFGGYVLNDRAAGGRLMQTAVGLSYMFSLRISDDLELRPALQGVYHNKKFDFQTFTFPDQIDVTGTLISGNSAGYEPYNYSTVDFSTGLLARLAHLEAGFSIHHLGAQSVNKDPATPLKFTLHAKYIFALNDDSDPAEVNLDDWADLADTKFVPYIQYTHQYIYQYINGGLIVQSGALFAGGGVKTALRQQVVNVALSAGFITSNFRIGYSMDFIALGGSLKGWSGLSHELFVHFSFGNNNGPVNRRVQGKKWRTRSTCGCYL